MERKRSFIAGSYCGKLLADLGAYVLNGRRDQIIQRRKEVQTRRLSTLLTIPKVFGSKVSHFR